MPGPAPTFRKPVNRMMKAQREITRLVTIALDVGGTTVKGICVGRDGDLLARQTVATFGAERSALDSVFDVIDALRTTVRVLGHEPAMINVGTPGIVSVRTGVVTYAANLGWIDLPLERLLIERFDLPTRIDHDARAAGVAEAAALELPAEELDLLFIPIGTGVSSAILVGGRLLGGATDSAGEIGHVSVFPGGEQCVCGQLGCVEAYSSASAILSRYRRAGGSNKSVSTIVGSLGHDPIAQHVWADAIDALARGIAATVATVDPAVIIIGGGLSQAGDALLEPLRRRLAESLTWRRAPSIRLSTLGSHSGVIGAAILQAPHRASERHRFVLRLLEHLQENGPYPIREDLRE